MNVPGVTLRGDGAHSPSSPEAIEDLIERSLALMTPWQRFRFRVRFWLRRVLGDLARRIPGYRTATLAIWRVKGQGLTGLWEPVYQPREADEFRADKRIPWHGWGVLCEPGGYRAHTPTAQTAELWPEPQYARRVLAERYRRGSRSEGATWVAARATGPASPQGNSGNTPNQDQRP